MQFGSADASVLDYARIPPRLKDLLRREACLIASQAQVQAALDEFHEQKREVEQSRPPFMFLQRKAVRQQFSQRLDETNQTLEALEQGVAKINELLPRLHTWITEELERLLVAGNTTYLNGLCRHRFPQDWDRITQRFALHAGQFATAAEQLHASVCALQRDQRIAGQLHIIDMVKVARVLGARLDADLAFFGTLATQQRALNQPNALPEIPVLRCETHVARIAMIDDANTRDLLARFVVRFKETAAVLLPACQRQGQLAAARAVGDLPSYIDAAWDLLRTHAIQDFNHDHMEQVLIETERMIERHDQS